MTSSVCQLPGCSEAVEQPPGGGPRKRFCCDTHRLQYWRLSQKASKTELDEPSFLGNDTSAVLALRDQLEQSVQTLEAAMTRTRTALIDLSSLEQAEAVRKEALASADELVARAQANQASEELRRQEAEALAEAASAQATEGEAQLHVAKATIKNLEHSVAELRQMLEQQVVQTEKTLEAARKDSAKAQDKLLQEVRSEIAARAKAEARAELAQAQVQELRAEIVLLRTGESSVTPAKGTKKKATSKQRKSS